MRPLLNTVYKFHWSPELAYYDKGEKKSCPFKTVNTSEKTTTEDAIFNYTFIYQFFLLNCSTTGKRANSYFFILVNDSLILICLTFCLTLFKIDNSLASQETDSRDTLPSSAEAKEL